MCSVAYMLQTEYGVKSSMVASDTNSSTIVLYIIVFCQYEMNRYVCDILLSPRPKFGKNVKYLLKFIFYLSQNQTLGICETKASKLHIGVKTMWPRHYHSYFCQIVEIDKKLDIFYQKHTQSKNYILSTKSEGGSVLAT